MSRIRLSTRWILATLAGDWFLESVVTQAWTSACDTELSLIWPHFGRICLRMIPAYLECVEGLRWAWPASHLSAQAPTVTLASCGST